MDNIKLTLYDSSEALRRDTFEKQLRELIPRYSLALENAKAGDSCYSGNLGWLKVDGWANDKWLDRYISVAETIQNNADVLVVVGVGGSNQAARAVIDCIGTRSNTEIIWAGNSLSAHSMNQCLEKLKGKRVYIDVIAKNFETLEPGLGFRVMRSWLKAEYGQSYGDHVICTGTEGSLLEKLCNEHGYTFLPFPDDVGGRYSALTPVGLIPMAAAGLDIRALVAGARQMEKQILAESPEASMALCFACARNLLYDRGYRMEMLSFFEPRLERFAKWWRQLFGESEGKEDKGLYPIMGNFSEDLHSVGQFLQEGTPIIYEVFLRVNDPEASYMLGETDIEDRFDYIEGKDLTDINEAAFKATLSAHSRRFPCFVLDIPRLDEGTFGQMFYFFMFSCYLSGKIMGINPFDQPGVEAYKAEMFKILGRKETE